jgi:uncharacterized protein
MAAHPSVTHASVAVTSGSAAVLTAAFLIAAFVIVAAAAAAQTIVGFGSALLAVPLLALVADPHTAVVGMSLIGLVPTAMIAVRDRAAVQWHTVGLVLLAAAVTMPLGLLVLIVAPDRVLTGLIAVVVLGCTYLVWRPPRVPAGPGPLLAVGGLAGVLTTATGTNGPPLVAALRALGYGPRAFRATLAGVFLGTGVVAVAGFLLAGAVTHRALLVTLVGVPAALVGWLIGERLFGRLDAVTFGRVVLAALVVCSVLTLGRALIG